MIERRMLPRIGRLPSAPRDAISDVSGVTVGHCTLDDGPVQTGVTVVRPHPGDTFRDRVPAAVAVLNGIGKGVGLLQIEELGVLDTPIALTNTFSVAAVAQAQIRQCIVGNAQTGRDLPTVNPLVLECNDGYLNDIQRLAVGEAHYVQALAAASPEVTEGAVGAGRGMSSFGIKGGIGTASRRCGAFTVGALVLANYGKPLGLTLAGRALGESLVARLGGAMQPEQPEKGSIIMLLATDAPLDARQLRRLAMRAGVGLARTGSVFGQGSGDIALAFSTAYTVPQDPTRGMPAVALLHDVQLDEFFQAAADSTEQAIIHALSMASAVVGRDGRCRRSLSDLLPDWPGEPSA